MHLMYSIYMKEIFGKPWPVRTAQTLAVIGLSAGADSVGNMVDDNHSQNRDAAQLTTVERQFDDLTSKIKESEAANDAAETTADSFSLNYLQGQIDTLIGDWNTHQEDYDLYREILTMDTVTIGGTALGLALSYRALKQADAAR